MRRACGSRVCGRGAVKWPFDRNNQRCSRLHHCAVLRGTQCFSSLIGCLPRIHSGQACSSGRAEAADRRPASRAEVPVTRPSHPAVVFHAASQVQQPSSASPVGCGTWLAASSIGRRHDLVTEESTMQRQRSEQTTRSTVYARR